MPNIAAVLRAVVGQDEDAGPSLPLNGIVALKQTETGWLEDWRLDPRLLDAG